MNKRRRYKAKYRRLRVLRITQGHWMPVDVVTRWAMECFVNTVAPILTGADPDV
jgi:hypothetical protein